MTPEQRIYAVMFNSIGPALKTAELWAPLFARQRIADSISAALAEQGYVIVNRPMTSGTPREVIASVIDGVVCDHTPADVLSCTPCKADMAVIALAEQGYAIVPVPDSAQALFAVLSGTAPQPSGTIQDASEGGPGISGRSDDPRGAASLSEPQPWEGNAVVLIDGQQIPIRANLTIQPASWSVDAHLNPADELYLPLGSCVVRLPDGREGAAIVTSVQNGVCGSLSGVGPPPTSKPLPTPITEEKPNA